MFVKVLHCTKTFVGLCSAQRRLDPAGVDRGHRPSKGHGREDSPFPGGGEGVQVAII